MKTYYEILQVAPEASLEVIKAAYKSLTKKYHPESGIEKDSGKFLEIEEAYTVLMDEQARQEYDDTLRKRMTAEGQTKKSCDGKNEKSDAVDIVGTDHGKSGDESALKDDKRSDGRGSILGKIFNIAFLIFIIACFVTNMEQYRMQIYNLIGKYEFNSATGDHEVCLHVKYENALLKTTPKVWLNVDGQRVAVLKEGDNYDYECKLSPGKHIVFVESKYLHINSETYTITVLPESDYTLADCSVTGKWLWGAEFTVKDTYR